MRVRKLTLGVAAAVLALPVAFAAASTAASADGVIPPVCAHPEVQPVCQAITSADNNGNTSTVAGRYNPHAVSDTNAADGTCVDVSSAAGEHTCDFRFGPGNAKALCTSPSATTAWGSYVYIPDQSESTVQITGSLFAEGGGVLDSTGIEFVSGSVVIVHVHIHVAGLCGNEDDAQSLVDSITTRGGLGSIDLSTAYKFAGYVDIV